MLELSNVVILRSVFGKVNQKYFIQPVRDPKTGRYDPCVRMIDTIGNMILSEEDKKAGAITIPENKVYIIEDGTSFDLNDPYQLADWNAIKNCNLISPSRDAKDSRGNLLIDGGAKRYGSAELYIERPGQETARKVTKKKLIHDAESFVYGDPLGAEGRLKIAKLSGKNMRASADADVTDHLLSIAQKNPQKIIDLYTGSDLAVRMLFMDAREKNIIYIKNKLYLYGDSVALGATDDACITFLLSPTNRKIVELIKKDTYPEILGTDLEDLSPLEKIKKTK